jgi:hypothetical protein
VVRASLSSIYLAIFSITDSTLRLRGYVLNHCLINITSLLPFRRKAAGTKFKAAENAATAACAETSHWVLMTSSQ